MFTKVKSWVLDRFEQSFQLFFSSKNNFLNLILPIFLYKLVIWIFLWNFVSYVLLWNANLENTDIFSNPYYVIIFFFIIVGFILYITFFVWFLIATIKTIKNIVEWEKIDIYDNLKYGFDNIITSFNTYWYIFAYITLWPFLFISIWWIFILIWDFAWIEIFKEIWLYTLGWWILFLLFFMIYRWVKTKFSLVSAIDKNSYTKENFFSSVELTKWNWWRIVGNFVFVSIVLSILFWIITSIFSFFKTSIFDVIDWKHLVNSYYNWWITQDNSQLIVKNIETYYDTFYLNNFLVSIIELFLTIWQFVFILIFTFLFYRRLLIEKQGLQKEEIEL